jgi:hypothetical protein
MTNSESQTHLDLADPVQCQSSCFWATVRDLSSKKILRPPPVVSYECTPARQVVRRTEFLGSLAIIYVLIMIMVACPTSRQSSHQTPGVRLSVSGRHERTIDRVGAEAAYQHTVRPYRCNVETWNAEPR